MNKEIKTLTELDVIKRITSDSEFKQVYDRGFLEGDKAGSELSVFNYKANLIKRIEELPDKPGRLGDGFEIARIEVINLIKEDE